MIKIEALKILIASAPKTGNTWLKAILSALFDLPIASLEGRFSPLQADSLGPRWVAHQHYCPTPEVMQWARRNNVHIITMVRHPADSLVSYYHYARNYPENFRGITRIVQAIEAEAARPRQPELAADQIGEGELIYALQDCLIADLSISISWIVGQYGETVRYEDLVLDPHATIARLARRFGDISQDAVQRAVDRCDLATLRKKSGADARFFRKGCIGEWRHALPEKLVRCLRDEEPYRSQMAFLDYKMDGHDPSDPPKTGVSQWPDSIAKTGRFENGVPIAPIFKLAFLAVPPERNQRWITIDRISEGSFFEWLNASAEDDPCQSSIPLITNLAAFIYRSRPDVQNVYPGIYHSGRVGYADWFLRYATDEYKVNRMFLTPVALSWIKHASPGWRHGLGNFGGP